MGLRIHWMERKREALQAVIRLEQRHKVVKVPGMLRELANGPVWLQNNTSWETGAGVK